MNIYLILKHLEDEGPEYSVAAYAFFKSEDADKKFDELIAYNEKLTIIGDSLLELQIQHMETHNIGPLNLHDIPNNLKKHRKLLSIEEIKERDSIERKNKILKEEYEILRGKNYEVLVKYLHEELEKIDSDFYQQYIVENQFDIFHIKVDIPHYKIQEIEVQ